MSERRRQPRLRTTGLSARVRPGHRVQVIDLSTDGALLEARQPMRPGANVEVQFDSHDRRHRLTARVVRCAVVSVHPDRGLIYRAGVSFDETCDLVRERITRDEYGVHAAEHSSGRTRAKDDK